MKTLKCPLCGTVLQFFHEPETEGMGRVGCSSCEWVTLLNPPCQAWKAAEEFISKFPPIMRVWPGDVILWGVPLVTVLDKDVECGELTVLDSLGKKYLLEQHVIEKWPWELEQEGGDE